MTSVEDFFNGIPNENNLTIDEIINFDNHWWDNEHNFIQWMFPLHESSMFNQSVPLIVNDHWTYYLSPHPRGDRMYQNLNRFMEFIYSDISFLYVRNHNWLRITRVLRSIRFFGLNNESIALYNIWSRCIDDKTTKLYWEKAATDYIWQSLK